MVNTCIDEIKHNNSELSKIEQEIKKFMKTLPYQLETMKGIEFVTAAALIAEIGDIGRFSNSDKLAKFSGICPVSHSSGDKEQNHRTGLETANYIIYSKV